MLCLIALQSSPVVAQSPPPRYSSGWWDVVAIAGGGVIAGAGPLARCAPCNVDDLPGIDRGVIGWRSGTARTGSDILVLGVAGGAMLGAVWKISPARARGDAVVLANALSWTTAATEWIKVAVHRARPALYRSGASDAATHLDNRKSFPSGHTAVAFAAATAYATLAMRQHLPHARRTAVLLYAGATLVGTLRVAGGRHFPSDVLAGAALGAGVGWLTVRLHPTVP